MARVKNGYWLAHRALGSRAKVYYGDVYDLPPELGLFDVSVVGMLLGHIRDPMQALISIARRTKGDLIVVDRGPEDARPIGVFAPDPATSAPANIWWSLSDACITRMMNVLGFKVTATVAPHRCTDGTILSDLPLTTFIGRREAW